MRFRRLMPVLCVAMLASIAFIARSQPAPAPAAAQTPPTRVAIVNPARVLKDIAETKALHEQLDVRSKELAAKEQQMRAEIEATVNDIKNTNPNFAGYDAKLDKLEQQKADLQAWEAATKASVERQQKKMLKRLYDQIEAACAEIAQRDGLDLVIPDARQEIPSVDQIPPDDLRRILNSRNILFAGKTIDITDKVMALLDKKYAENKAAQGGVAQPPAK